MMPEISIPIPDGTQDQTVIELPAISITTTVVGESGEIYLSTLVQDTHLGRPTYQLQSP